MDVGSVQKGNVDPGGEQEITDEIDRRDRNLRNS